MKILGYYLKVDTHENTCVGIIVSGSLVSLIFPVVSDLNHRIALVGFCLNAKVGSCLIYFFNHEIRSAALTDP